MKPPKMKNKSLGLLFSMAITVLCNFSIKAQTRLDSLLPVRGFSIDVPRPAGLDSFIHFIDADLAPHKINLLVVQMEYHYQFTSHPELTDSFALSKADVKRIVAVCKKNNIRVIPQINFLGHQSWANHIGKLLRVYPQLDETPAIQLPVKYEWPNADNLYCKSYCPLHPDLHPVIFAVMDELCDAFESNAFHAGMDEVFYIGESQCPRCWGRDKAELFAGEVRAIHDHLQLKGRQLWIWGDRLLDGRTTGLGQWEASYNNTYRAIDMIPKDIVICDWHYERPDKTAIYFAMKGLQVITCPWRQPSTTVSQINDMISFRRESSSEMQARLLGVMETTWMRTSSFLDSYYINRPLPPSAENEPWNCFRVFCDTIDKL